MRKIGVLGLLAFMITSCGGSKSIKVERDEDAIKYAATITANDLKEHLSILASDEYEGRETGMAGQKKAAEYIQNYYKGIGVKGGMTDGSYQQSFPLLVNDPRNIELSILKYAVGEADGGRPAKFDLNFLDHFYYLGGFRDTTFKDVDMVFAGYGIQDSQFKSYTKDVKGKMVIILEGEPEGVELVKDWNNWRLKLATAKEQGAIGVFTIQKGFKENVDRIRYFIENPRMQLHNKGNKEKKKKKSTPNVYISDSLSKVLLSKDLSELKSIGSAQKCLETGLKLNMRSFFKRTDLSSENILGFIEGSDPDLKEEILVLSAHYDHIGYDNGEICNGADDDGSGTVAVLEIAQAFKEAQKAGKGPKRSILFLNVSGEEKGLLGSQYYVENPVYSLENTITDLNVDMIGRIDTNHTNDNYIYLIGADKLSSDLHEISEGCNQEYSNIELDYTYNNDKDPNRFYYRSDHYNFAKNDIPVIFYFSGVHEDYHKPTDEVDKIMFPKMERITRLIFHTAWELANIDKRPEIDYGARVKKGKESKTMKVNGDF